ncbi:hypothetical protein H2203_008167 [Taxawa tesnikishii (nom. ined.)]|nr:hypothetical protein H2203_008167 [Dothideales sp. JES 119]
MSNRRVKDVDYDDDDIYSDEEYGEEGGYYDNGGQEGSNDAELSPEDQEQMRQGTTRVREALGSAYPVSDQAIQEALWHYYYDVAKSVSYLKNQVAPQQPKKAVKQESKFDKAANAAAAQTASKGKKDDTVDYWFKDVPWFNVPPEMTGKIVIEALQPPLRLLGGSGKPSKLAALAAARKKKEAEQKAASGQAAESSDEKHDSTAASLLDRLGTRSNRTAPVQSTETPKDVPSASQPAPQRMYPIRKKKSPSPPPPDLPQASPLMEITPNRPEKTQPDLRAGPSVFASAMIKEADDAKKDSKAVNGVANGISNVSLEEAAPAPKVKSKNLDVLAEYEKSQRKNAASFVVIGHVDHGKSTLMGRLLYDLKVVDQRSLDKYRKEATNLGKSSFALAWVMDSTSEERERGVTVDIAMNHFETDRTKFTILDAPGHRDFIPNMIAGASQADFAVLVIDAGTNSFEAGLKGQTKEHALLVRSMGVQRVVVAVNKMDSIDWNEERFTEIKQQMSAFLTSAGFQGKNLAFIPCAGLTGENVVEPAPASAAWYKDPSKYESQTLIQALEAYEPAKAAVSLPLRLSISDVFRGGVTNPLSISGKIDAGSLQVGDSILAMPAGESATIKGIEIEHEAADWAVAGQIVILHLTDIDPVHLRVGDIVCSPQKPIQNISAFTTKILAFEHVLPMQVDVHRGRLHVPGRITQLVGLLDKSSGQITKKKPRVVQPGTVARVRVELDSAVPLEVPGRVVLRSGGATVAAGLLEQVHQ